MIKVFVLVLSTILNDGRQINEPVGDAYRSYEDCFEAMVLHSRALHNATDLKWTGSKSVALACSAIEGTVKISF